MSVDIICSVRNGERFLPDLIHSLEHQSVTDWRLWVRDDGSTDGTPAQLRSATETDARIRVLNFGGPSLGVAGGFGWLLERVPVDSEYVMCADADDVWLPEKIERTLRAMHDAEAESSTSTPILVHTDLIVVDEQLNRLHSSFWTSSGLARGPVTLRRLAIQNVVTAPTVMLNRALRELVGSTPPAARFQDWWYAMTAVAFGRVVAVHEPTVLYRQHGANVVGAAARAPAGWREIPLTLFQWIGTTPEFRRDLRTTAAQARAFVDRYGDRLGEDDRRFLHGFSQIPEQRLLPRKLALLKYRVPPQTGLLSTLGILLRG